MNTIPVIPTDDTQLEAAGSPARVVACPERGEGDTTPEAALEQGLRECPLQTAMRHVAEAALTQHVLYAEGVYRPREGLLHEMQAWLRLHELVYAGICPATRVGNALAPAELETALVGLPVEMRAQMATPLRVCGRRSRGEGCPLDAQPVASLIE